MYKPKVFFLAVVAVLLQASSGLAQPNNSVEPGPDGALLAVSNSGVEVSSALVGHSPLGVRLPYNASSEPTHASDGENDQPWATLRSLRLEHHTERRREGWVLLGWGVVSAVGGLVMAIAGRNDSFWLSHGLTTLSFAAFNIPLGIGLLDVGGSRLRDIELNRAGESVLYRDVLDAAISGQTGKRASLAVNGALDVLYILGGALLVGLASRTCAENTAAGAGWAMIGQGGALLALDIYGVIVTSRRVRELRRLQ